MPDDSLGAIKTLALPKVAGQMQE